ncbi:MAG: polyhydroxyalkanoate synthesis regulator DNA-binding domain-containing protein [Candidatus Korobacteraceae bacterium]
MEKKIIIKKYENRRLYDVTHSRYVNLDEIARTVQDGVDIQVLDASSGEDITRLVMTQIVTECAKAPDSVFPLDILRQMVVASGKASQESAMNYMRAVTDMYKNALRGFTKTMTPFELMQTMMSSAPGTPAEQFSPEQMAAVAAGTQTLAAQQAQESAEIQELKQRIQELEAMVQNLGKAPEPAKKGARKRSGS